MIPCGHWPLLQLCRRQNYDLAPDIPALFAFSIIGAARSWRRFALIRAPEWPQVDGIITIQ
jgi:uncharacterized protein Usg